MRKVRSSVTGLALLSLPLAAFACSAPGDASTSEDVSQAEELVTNCGSVFVPVASKSLFVTDPTVLADFSIARTLDQIATTGDSTGLTGVKLYQQLVDTLNKAPGDTKGPHCTGTINGFPADCPREEGTLATTDPTSSGNDGYIPLGVVNRFDLAPADGSNCGQFRVVYGKRSGLTNAFDRTLLIFEAVLPNPTPTKGIAACLPVEELWNGLSNPKVTSAQAASKLASFYYTGLTGFAPVVNAAHYGFGNTTNTGQIRMNTFNGDWQLREFRLAQTCVANGDAGSKCTLLAHNTVVQDNPEGSLFSGTDSTSLAFQKEFISQVPSLAANDINLIAMSTPTVDNSGESDESNPTLNNYLSNGGSNSALTSAIQTKLTAIKSTLTPDDILNRATTQACAGCHQLSPGTNLGGKLVWPASNGFTQIDEHSNLSPALTETFLPFRANVQLKYLDAQCGVDGGIGQPDSGKSDSGSSIDAGGGGGTVSSDASTPPPPPPEEDAGPPQPLTVGGGLVGASN